MKKLILLPFVFLIFLTEKNIAQTTYTFTGKPRYKISTTRGGVPLGDILIELYPKIAPKHVRNFDSLVSTKFYDTTAFHRVIPGFMIQGGDPNSRHGNVNTWGQGQASQPKVDAEFSPLLKHLRGTLSAARSSNINSATSQFFICVAPAAQLDGNYSIYGKAIAGMNWVDTIVNTPRNAQDRPLQKIEMFVTYVGSNDTVPATSVPTFPVNGVEQLDTLSSIQLKWAAVPGTFFYHLDVSTDSLFVNDTIRSIDLLSLSYTLIKPQLAGTTYYWRVIANNGGNTSTSKIQSFKTMSPDYLGINSNNLSNEKLKVYPNPSNGKFAFYNLEKESNFQVFDVNGKLIFQTETKENTLNLDLEGREKGIYMFRISNSKKEIQQGKLILK